MNDVIEMKYKLNNYYHEDCLVAMKDIPNKFFDLAIVDPPYFKGPENRMFYGNDVNKLNIRRKQYGEIKCWNVPGQEYFDELVRISKNQIIWGINYFDVILGPGRIIWDKCNGTSSFSDAEIAYCSLHDSVRLFPFMWNGMMQGKSISQGRVMQGDKSKNEIRIYQTQKPVALYEWILQNYAKPGDKILDTHVGSASSLIACYNMGFEFIGFEKDEDMYKKSMQRLKQRMDQVDLFNIEIES